MVGQINRRRVKKRKRQNQNSKMKFTVVLAIMIIAVVLGYGTARFVIGPLLGYDADESPIKSTGQTEKEASEKEGAPKVGETKANTAPEDGYALQFGVFSSREAAEKLTAALAEKGVKTQIIETDNVFKVISPVINTKDEAIASLNEIKDKEVEDVFIASF